MKSTQSVSNTADRSSLSCCIVGWRSDRSAAVPSGVTLASTLNSVRSTPPSRDRLRWASPSIRPSDGLAVSLHVDHAVAVESRPKSRSGVTPLTNSSSSIVSSGPFLQE